MSRKVSIYAFRIQKYDSEIGGDVFDDSKV